MLIQSYTRFNVVVIILINCVILNLPPTGRSWAEYTPGQIVLKFWTTVALGDTEISTHYVRRLLHLSSYKNFHINYHSIYQEIQNIVVLKSINNKKTCCKWLTCLDVVVLLILSYILSFLVSLSLYIYIYCKLFQY